MDTFREFFLTKVQNHPEQIIGGSGTVHTWFTVHVGGKDAMPYV